MMSADTKDTFQLLRTCCKALSNFDAQVAARVAQNSESDAEVEEPDARDALFRVAQFLHLVATKQASEPCNLNPLMTSRPQEWVAGMKNEDEVAVDGGSGINATLGNVALRLGTTFDQLCQEIKQANKLKRVRVDKEKKSAKPGKDKHSECSLRVILSTSEPTPEGLQGADGNPVTSRRTKAWCPCARGCCPALLLAWQASIWSAT